MLLTAVGADVQPWSFQTDRRQQLLRGPTFVVSFWEIIPEAQFSALSPDCGPQIRNRKSRPQPGLDKSVAL